MATFLASAGSAPSETLRMAVFYHPACELHEIEGHPEQPQRVGVILARLRQEWSSSTFRQVKQKVSDEVLCMFHAPRHVSRFNALCAQVESSKKQYSYDGDTQIMPNTREAALYAAGAMIEALDCAHLPDSDPNKIDTAFCCVRPPGHHAERNRSMGFCFLSNAAIGAKYAQKVHGVGKVAVIDFDVHHGNGTEEGFRDHANLYYGSTHEFEAFPCTGEDHYPYVGDRAKREIDRRIVDRVLYASGARAAAESPRVQFRTKWRHVIEEMVRFGPELVIISAGFDAHERDPLASCDLLEEDFSWATEIVLEACVRIDPERPPRCVSILEGGYDLDALSSSAAAHVRALARGYPAPPAKGDEAAALARYVDSLGLGFGALSLASSSTSAAEGEVVSSAFAHADPEGEEAESS